MSREYEDVSPELGGRFVEHLRGTLVAELGVPILRDDRRIPSIDVLVPTERRRDVLELAVGQVTDAAWEAAIAQGSGRLPTKLTVVLDLEFGRDASLRVALSFERDTPASYLDLLERAPTIVLHFLDVSVDIEPPPLLVALDVAIKPLDPFHALAEVAEWISGI